MVVPPFRYYLLSTRSALHTEGYIANKSFLIVVAGKKEWVFYDFDDTVNLYQVGSHFNVDAFDVDKVLKVVMMQMHYTPECCDDVCVHARSETIST